MRLPPHAAPWSPVPMRPHDAALSNESAHAGHALSKRRERGEPVPTHDYSKNGDKNVNR